MCDFVKAIIDGITIIQNVDLHASFSLLKIKSKSAWNEEVKTTKLITSFFFNGHLSSEALR